MTLHQLVIISQSPWCTLRFALGAAHSMALDECVMARTYHYGTMKGIFTTLTILFAL